jgi:glucose/mannose-6-phosphate isomerase
VSDPLSAEAVAAVDQSNLAADVLDLPSQLHDATWRVESAMLEPVDAPGGLVVAGMGGSAIGGALARAALGDQASRPIVVTRTYGLPAWTSPEVTVLCSSYSGNTEETLGCYEAAGALGARRIVVTTGGSLAEAARADKVPVIPLPGGLQPRCAVAYMTVAALEVAALSGVGPEMRSEVDVAAALVEKLVDRWGPGAPADALPKALATDLHDTVSVISGSGPTVPVAYRWKTQLNENSKVPAFAGELPEVDHNEIVGWGGNEGLGRFSAVFLDDTDLHPRTRRRIALTRELVAPNAVTTHVIEGEGETTLARVFSLVLLGDLLSLYRAVLRGVDPTPVEVIERLKSSLASEQAPPAAR